MVRRSIHSPIRIISPDGTPPLTLPFTNSPQDQLPGSIYIQNNILKYVNSNGNIQRISDIATVGVFTNFNDIKSAYDNGFQVYYLQSDITEVNANSYYGIIIFSDNHTWYINANITLTNSIIQNVNISIQSGKTLTLNNCTVINSVISTADNTSVIVGTSRFIGCNYSGMSSGVTINPGSLFHHYSCLYAQFFPVGKFYNCLFDFGSGSGALNYTFTQEEIMNSLFTFGGFSPVNFYIANTIRFGNNDISPASQNLILQSNVQRCVLIGNRGFNIIDNSGQTNNVILGNVI